MLVLGRKLGQKVIIAEEITVKIVDVTLYVDGKLRRADSAVVRLGFDAKKDIQIRREEIEAH
jgi:carbon storage regulator CsrA